MSHRAMLALLAVALAVVAVVPGLGDRRLWDRWTAERDLWKLRAEAARLGGSVADSASLLAVEARALALSRDGALGGLLDRDALAKAERHTALARGRAVLLAAELATRRGDDPTAERRLAALAARAHAFPRLQVEARLSRIAALQRLGRFDEALAERERVAVLDPLGDPDRRGPAPEVVEAAIAAGREWARRGSPADAERVHAAAAAAHAAAAARARGRDSLVLCDALALLHDHRGLPAEALAVRRAALANAPAGERAGRLLVMAQGALGAGAPDSAVVYARWAAAIGSGRRLVGNALFTAAQAWEALGQPDSAIAGYDAVLRRWADPGALGAPAHYERARLLERRGDWINARAEYLALSASQPTHPLAFQAAKRLVQHPFEQGEAELARVQGQQEIDKLGHLVATNYDPQVRRQAGLVRADLLLVTGRLAEAESSYVALWRQFPGDSAAEDAALRGARLGAHLPGGARRSREVFEALAKRAVDPVVRRAAAAEAAAAAAAQGGDE